MRSLAFDTTGAQCAVSLWVDDAVAAQEATVARHGHAVLLAPMIAAVLARSGIAARALDRLAVTRGPGGFTGVRVGLATARGLAMATGAPVYGPTTFEALLLSAPAVDSGGHDCIVAVVDSRLEAVFVQVFDAAHRPLHPPRSCAVTAVPGLLPRGARRPLVVGDAAERGAAALKDGGYAVAGVLDVAPDVVALARVTAGLPFAAFGLPAPLYLAPPAVKPAEVAFHGSR